MNCVMQVTPCFFVLITFELIKKNGRSGTFLKEESFFLYAVKFPGTKIYNGGHERNEEEQGI